MQIVELCKSSRACPILANVRHWQSFVHSLDPVPAPPQRDLHSGELAEDRSPTDRGTVTSRNVLSWASVVPTPRDCAELCGFTRTRRGQLCSPGNKRPNEKSGNGEQWDKHSTFAHRNASPSHSATSQITSSHKQITEKTWYWSSVVNCGAPRPPHTFTLTAKGLWSRDSGCTLTRPYALWAIGTSVPSAMVRHNKPLQPESWAP